MCKVTVLFFFMYQNARLFFIKLIKINKQWIKLKFFNFIFGNENGDYKSTFYVYICIYIWEQCKGNVHCDKWNIIFRTQYPRLNNLHYLIFLMNKPKNMYLYTYFLYFVYDTYYSACKYIQRPSLNKITG